MKKNVWNVLVIFVMSVLLFSCNRKDEQEEQKQNASDAGLIQSGAEEIAREVNDALTGNVTTSGRTAVANTNCNVTINATNASSGTLVLTLNGLNCDGTRTRSGVITVQLLNSAKWKDVGAVATITMANVRITRVSDGKSITVNGVKTITNVNGGIYADLAVGSGSVVHTVVSSNMVITFDDGTIRTWSVARRRTLTRETTGYVVKLEGTASQGGFSNVSEWGQSRSGLTFYGTITSPIIFRESDCPRGPVSGQRVIHGLVYKLTIDFGVNQDGTAFSGSGCPYGMKIKWTGRRGREREFTISY